MAGRVRTREPIVPRAGAKRGRRTSGTCHHRDRDGRDDCRKTTTEGKAMCIDHITEMPYVQRIISGANQRDDARERED